MAASYDETPLIFLNSTDHSVPHGRNVRVRERCQRAAPPARQAAGQIIVFACQPNGIPEQQRVRQRRKHTERAKRKPPRPSVCQAQPSFVTSRPSLSPGRKTSLQASKVRPGDLLALAASHIRRMAAITLRSQTPRVHDVLRCRQWSCISLEFDGLEQTPFLHGAVRCVEAKLRQIAFDNISPLLVLSEYDRALQSLHEAVQARKPAQERRVLTAIQLLAIFEMLDGPDNPCWQKHVSGARSLFEMQLSSPVRRKACQRRPLIQSAPMLADALLENNCEYFQKAPWRALLYAAIAEQFPKRQDAEALVACFADIPGLMTETERLVEDASLGIKLDIVSRAQGVKIRIKTALVEGKMDAPNDDGSGSRFDVMGLSMAGLFALDHIIAALTPSWLEPREFVVDKTDEVCIRLLESESVRADSWVGMEAMFKAQQ